MDGYPDFSICERVLSSRWMLGLLEAMQVSCRFGDLQDRFTGLSRSVLAAQLQELRQLGLCSQTRYPGFPPRVEYMLTDKGRSLLEILSQLPAQIENA